MELPPEVATLVMGRLDLGPARSELLVDTELLTAANTSRAKEIPDVEPRYRASDAPCTETMPIFDTSLFNLSASSCFFSQSSFLVANGESILGDCGPSQEFLVL